MPLMLFRSKMPIIYLAGIGDNRKDSRPKSEPEDYEFWSDYALRQDLQHGLSHLRGCKVIPSLGYVAEIGAGYKRAARLCRMAPSVPAASMSRWLIIYKCCAYDRLLKTGHCLSSSIEWIEVGAGVTGLQRH